jgi:hypothetical protein
MGKFRGASFSQLGIVKTPAALRITADAFRMKLAVRADIPTLSGVMPVLHFTPFGV